MKETTFEKAKVGDFVWSFTLGWGVITEIDRGRIPSGFPLKVQFRYNNPEYYNDNGTLHAVENQSLFWDEIKLVTPIKPKKETGFRANKTFKNTQKARDFYKNLTPHVNFKIKKSK